MNEQPQPFAVPLYRYVLVDRTTNRVEAFARDAKESQELSHKYTNAEGKLLVAPLTIQAMRARDWIEAPLCTSDKCMHCGQPWISHDDQRVDGMLTVYPCNLLRHLFVRERPVPESGVREKPHPRRAGVAVELSRDGAEARITAPAGTRVLILHWQTGDPVGGWVTVPPIPEVG